MVFCLFFHSSIIILLLFIFNRWVDDELLGDICLYSLIIELVVAIFNITYIYYTNSIFFLNIGTILTNNFFFNINLLLCFDELSGFFFAILDVALILCFFFLIEYFEYDSNSTSIILLSAAFSHFAIWYFCIFDLFLLTLFWESISLISFLLIQHWSYRLPSYKAGIKVFFISQLGDLPIFFFIFLLINRFHTTDIGEIVSQLFFLVFEYILLLNFIIINLSNLLATLLSFALLLKSAQFFFYPWLLDAMEAPVPISAQLHSSTLVIIGFYFYLRFQLMFMLSSASSLILLYFGFFTIIGASVLGFFQEDGKKLLACSTASQLGYAIAGLGLHFFEESLFLMIFCCCNKAFTFIWFGILMDKLGGISDFRFISGNWILSWFEHSGLLVSISNFTVFPGLFCWHVKSLFLKGQIIVNSTINIFLFDLLLLTWFFSSLYLIYLYIILFLKPNRALSGNSFLFFNTELYANKANNIACNSVILKLKRLINLRLSHMTFLLNYLVSDALSSSFFVLLIFAFCLLASPLNFFFYNFVDNSWLLDFFYFSNFFFYNYYL